MLGHVNCSLRFFIWYLEIMLFCICTRGCNNENTELCNETWKNLEVIAMIGATKHRTHELIIATYNYCFVYLYTCMSTFF